MAGEILPHICPACALQKRSGKGETGMGVRIREKVSGSGVWWVFVNHRGQRASTKVGSQKVKENMEARLKLGLEVFPARKPTASIPTLESFYCKFEAGYLKTACRESTVQRYSQCFRLHLQPKLGSLPLNEITRERIKELIAELVLKGLAKHTIRNVTASLCAILSSGVEDGIITSNPATKLGKFFKSARVVHEKIEPLTAAEVPVFLEVSKQRDAARPKDHPEYCPVFLAAIHTGMRAGELAGLQWGDIDWNGKFLVVRRSVKNGKVLSTKTDRIRRIDMSDALIEELAAFRRRRLEKLMQTGRNELPEWVFASAAGTPLDMHNLAKREFSKCLAASKLRRIRFHDLRHTFASLLLQNGESPQYVREQMGHSSIRITVDTYGHLIPGANRQAVNRLPSLSFPHPIRTLKSERL